MPGDFSKVVNAQNVLFSYGNPLSELITLFNVRLVDEIELDRRNARGGPIDTPSFNLVEIIADAVLDKEVYDDFRALTKLTSRGALIVEDFLLDAEALSGGGDDFVTSGEFIMRRMESHAAEKGKYEVTITIRIVNNTLVN